MKKIKDLRNLTKDLENDAKLKMLENLHEKGKCVGYTTVEVEVISGRKGRAVGTVFHNGGSWLYTCAHVVKLADEDVKDTFVLDRQKITFKWIDLDSEGTETHTYSPPQCDHAPPCECGHRIGIFTNITNDEGEIDEDKIDLAIFREDQISHLQLPTIMFQSSVNMEFRTTPKVDIMPQVPDSHESSLEKLYREKNETTYMGSEDSSLSCSPDTLKEKMFWKGKNETTGLPVDLYKHVTSEPVISSNGDTLYHIYWDFESDTPTKMFYIKERIGDKSIGPYFEFDSPAPDGASGSPVMVYQKVYEDCEEEEFCLAGIMSGGEEYIQVAELPESIQQHSKLMMRFNNLHHQLVQYRELSDHFKKSDDDRLKETIFKKQKDVKEEIIGILRDNELKGIFLGSLCIRDDEIAAN